VAVLGPGRGAQGPQFCSSPPVSWLPIIFTRDSRILRASSHRLGVCLSVCLSGTLVICVKTVQARITKFSPRAASRSLVFRDRISCPWVQGFPSNESVEEGYFLKRYFAVIGSYSVKTVADRYRHAAYYNKHWWQAFRFINIDDLKRPWTPKKVFSEFFALSGCNAQFNTELRRNG